MLDAWLVTPVRRFVVLLVILSIPFYMLGVLVPLSALPIKLPLSALMAINPLIAAVILTYCTESIVAVRILLCKPFVDARIHPGRWHLVLLLLMPLLISASYGIKTLVDGRVTEVPTPPTALPVLLMVFIVSGYLEEIGWQGYLIAPLRARLGLLSAGFVLGVIWSFWHIIPFLQTGNSTGWVFWQSLFTLAFRMIIVWVCVRTGNSVFAAIMLHGTCNAAVFMLPNFGSAYDPMFAAMVTLVVVVIVYLWKGKS